MNIKRVTPSLIAILALSAACSGSASDTTAARTSAPQTTASPTNTEPGSPETSVGEPDILRPTLAIVRTNEDNTDIYLVDEEGAEVRLTDHESYDEYPAVSPDGTRVAFDSYRTGDWETFVVNIDGTGLRQLTEAPGEDGYPSWSPDGDSMVIDSERDGDFEIYIIDVETGAVTQLTDNDAWDGEPAWSPGGERIAFHSNRDGDGVFDLYLMDADGTNVERLTENAFSPAWSPDGATIAFGREPLDGGDRNLWTIDVESGSEQSIARGDAWDDEPAWSADGTRILFSSDRDGPFQVYSMLTDGSDVQPVAGGDDDTFSPAVFPAS